MHVPSGNFRISVPLDYVFSISREMATENRCSLCEGCILPRKTDDFTERGGVILWSRGYVVAPTHTPTHTPP